MAKPELSLIEERDETQRALGCVGLSAFAHLGLLVMILIAPSLKQSAGVITGTTAGIELPGDSMATAAANGLPQATNTSGPVEVMLADANDASAVELAGEPQLAQPAAAVAAPVAAAPVVEAPQPKPPVKIAKVAKAKSISAKPAAAIESQDISSALTQARTEAAIETEDASDVEAPTAQDEALAEAPTTQANEEEDEAVPLQVALPEDESLTQAQANALQAPGANTNAIPADAKPIETVSRTTGAVITRPANSGPVVATNTTPAPRGIPNGTAPVGQTAGTVSGATQSRGGNSGIGIPNGSQIRDARSLQAMPGNPLATYPLPDRVANREGTAVLVGRVRNDGRVENVMLEKSSGSRLMDESAAKAFAQWKYKPGQEGYVRLPMQFKLVGDAHVIPAELQRQ